MQVEIAIMTHDFTGNSEKMFEMQENSVCP